MPSYRPQIPNVNDLSFRQKLGILGRVFVYVGPYKRFMVLLFLLTLVEVGLTVVEPFLAQFIIDDVLVQRDAGLLNIVFAAMIGLFLVRSFYGFVVQYISFYMQSRVNFDIRKRFFNHLQRQSVRFYQQNPLADIVHTEGSNLPELQEFLIGSLDELSNQIIHLIAGATLLFLMSWKLALLSLLALPIWVLGTLYFTRKMAPIGQEMNEQDIRIEDTFHEIVNGVEVVKTFNRQPYERKRYFGELARDSKLSIDQMVWSTAFGTTVGSISVISGAFVFWFGGHQIIQGNMTVGQLIAFNMLLGGLFGPVGQLLNFFQQINQITIAGLRVFAYWDMEPEIQSPSDALALRNVQGNVEFVDVGFGYENDEPVLEDVSFEVLPGQMVAFVGPSGSGKSTIAKLLMRFYDPTAGEVYIDGFDLRELNVASVRGAMGVVSQRPFMFQDTIGNNIRYGRLDASDLDIERAARLAQADDFIRNLPEGYNTELGAGGSGLSGGQVQRLSIARTLLADPKILILDEATSALDTDTERQIQEALEIVLEGRTTFVIAHRLSTIVRADRIYVLRDGRIVEQGTHSELLALKGDFHTLWQHQLGDEWA